MKKVTVVIPNYNGIKYIQKCLESLYRLKEQALFQVLMVDNGSTDGSLELVREQFTQVQVEALPDNTGFCHAVNVGIRLTQTPYVLLLNNDTEVSEGFVERLTAAMERDERIFAVSSKMLQWQDPARIDDAGDQYCVLGWAYARGKDREAARFDTPARIFAACGGASLYRRRIFDEIGMFDEAHFAYLEDIDISYRAAIYGYHCLYEPSASVLHYGSATSGSRYNTFKTGLASANSVYLILKNMPVLQILWNLPFLLAGFLVKWCFYARKGMGMLYGKGLVSGVRKGFCTAGQAARVPFRWKHLGNYLKIQGLLYLNTIRMLVKQ